MQDNKTSELQVEQVNIGSDPQYGDSALAEIVLEDHFYQGINRQTVLAFLAICGQLNAYEMALLIPSTTLPYINAELGPSPSYTWITVSWTLGAAILVSVGGRLSDIFGRRYFMLAGASLAFVGTIVGATGKSINQMIASGVILGVGSGFQEMGFACFMEFIPNKYRLTFCGLYGTSAIISLLSPLVSYAFIAHTSIGWRGAYWYMCAWHACAGIFLFFFYKPPTFYTKHRTDGKSKSDLIRELDYVGLFLFVAGCTLFLIGVNFGGRQHPWKSASVIVPIVVGTCALVGLFFWEFNAKLDYPLLPPKLFRQWRRFNVNVGVSFLCGMLYYSMQVLWPRESQLLFVPADDVILRGVYANITSFGTFVAVLSVALFCSRIHHERWQIVAFIVIQTALVGSLASAGVNDKVQAIVTVFILSCCINQPLYMLFTMVSLGLEDQADIGVAIGVISTFRLLGGAIATAIYTAILTSSFQSKLPSEILNVVKGTGFSSANIGNLTAAAAIDTAVAYEKVPGITPKIIEACSLGVKIAYTESYKIVYLAALAFGGLGIMCALCTLSTDRTKKTSTKAVVLENERFEQADTEKV